MKILVAIDELGRSREALRWVAMLAGESPPEVSLLTVVPPRVSPPVVTSGAGGWQGPPGTAVWEAPATHEQVLARAQAFLREKGIEAEVKLVHGDPYEAILAEAQEGEYDLLVLGTRRSGLAGTLSSRVAEDAPCPVEIVGRTHLVRVALRG